MIKRIIYSLIFLLGCATKPCFAMVLPENHAVNGGLTIIPVNIKKQPEAYYQGKRIAVIPSTQLNQWLLIVAIPLNIKDAIQYIDIKKPFKTTVPFQVSDKFYATQFLKIKDLSKVDPQTQDIIRINKETQKLTTIFAHYSHTNPFEQQFAAPLRGPVTSLFGLKRIYNQQPRDPHSGLDIAHTTGSPVYSVNQGIVVETGDYFFTGNTVIIDHGMGVFSLYAHLSKILVTTGELIKKGQELGLVGMTGRVTGPHLHWAMIMNQTLVEPLLFVPIRQINISSPAPSNKSHTEPLRK